MMTGAQLVSQRLHTYREVCVDPVVLVRSSAFDVFSTASSIAASSDEAKTGRTAASEVMQTTVRKARVTPNFPADVL
jgi:hypothetical protein